MHRVSILYNRLAILRHISKYSTSCLHLCDILFVINEDWLGKYHCIDHVTLQTTAEIAVALYSRITICQKRCILH